MTGLFIWHVFLALIFIKVVSVVGMFFLKLLFTLFCLCRD